MVGVDASAARHRRQEPPGNENLSVPLNAGVENLPLPSRDNSNVGRIKRIEMFVVVLLVYAGLTLVTDLIPSHDERPIYSGANIVSGGADPNILNQVSNELSVMHADEEQQVQTQPHQEQTQPHPEQTKSYQEPHPQLQEAPILIAAIPNEPPQEQQQNLAPQQTEPERTSQQKHHAIADPILRDISPKFMLKDTEPLIKDMKDHPFASMCESVGAMAEDQSKEHTPVFWALPPNDAGGMTVNKILDKCFDLTRAEVVGGDGTHNVVHGSSLMESTGNTQEGISEDVIVLSNLNLIPTVFNPSKPDHTAAKMFSFIMNPVYRSAYMIKYLQRADHDPHYDERLKDFTLADHANFLMKEGNQNHYHLARVSNWITRSLLGFGSDRGVVLGQRDVELATKILREKFIVGMYEEMGESLKRLKVAFGWELGEVEDCFSKTLSGPVIDTSFVGVQEFKLLEELNQADMQLYRNAKQIFEEQSGMMMHQLRKVSRDSLATNPLFPIFRDVSSLREEKSINEGVAFWLIPPILAGGRAVNNILDKCFDLTRAEVVGADGAVNIVHQSTKHPNQEDVLTFSNLNVLPLIFDPSKSRGKGTFMFSFLLHPVHRAAHMMKHIQGDTKHPNFDPRVSGMDLATYAEFLMKPGNENHFHLFRTGNWLTRSIAQADRTAVLGPEHLDLATNILREKCLIGLYEEVEESFRRFQTVFGWDMADGGDDKCISNSMKEPLIDENLEQSKEWALLEKMNMLDVQLYKNAKLIFAEQGKNILADGR